MHIKQFFDKNYTDCEYYWWKGSNRYSTEENQHTHYYSIILHEAKKKDNCCALDLGAGEGADSIRLALLGCNVDAVELSEVGASKINRFAMENGVKLNVICNDICKYVYSKTYDIIMCNGVLHYVKNKESIINDMKMHTRIGGINCVSLFSSFSPIPDCHKVVPVYPDTEGGIIEQLYSDWEIVYKSYEHNKIESSHDEMPPHSHSFIKLICRRLS